MRGIFRGVRNTANLGLLPGLSRNYEEERADQHDKRSFDCVENFPFESGHERSGGNFPAVQV
jgi:hypothetical protein